MGKALYGQGKASNSRKRETLVADGEADWLTLTPAVEGSKAEDARSKKMSAALGAFTDEAGMSDALAASLVEYSTDGTCDSMDAWTSTVAELFNDMGITLADDDDDAEQPSAGSVVHALCKCGALVNTPPPLPPPRIGDPVLAVLEEDGEWHAAMIESEPVAQGSGPPLLVVRFLEWPKVQTTKRANVVPLAAAIGDDGDDDDDDDGEGGEGECVMCARRLKLTFHHLVPKATHSKYVGRFVPPGLPEDAVPTKMYLNSYGLMVCRACHSVIHRHAPNAVLALKFNTLERLLDAPSIAKWVDYAAGARKGARGNR